MTFIIESLKGFGRLLYFETEVKNGVKPELPQHRHPALVFKRILPESKSF